MANFKKDVSGHFGDIRPNVFAYVFNNLGFLEIAMMKGEVGHSCAQQILRYSARANVGRSIKKRGQLTSKPVHTVVGVERRGIISRGANTY
jgi:hypothetical protein